MLQKFSSYSVDQPRPGQLLAVAIASGLPFVGFGFVDNLVMVRRGGLKCSREGGPMYEALSVSLIFYMMLSAAVLWPCRCASCLRLDVPHMVLSLSLSA